MNLLPNELARLAWSQLWQVTVLAAMVGVAVRIGCRRRPHLAYVLWMLVVLKCLAPPLWSSPAGFFSWAQFRVEQAKPVSEPQIPEMAGQVVARVPDRPERSLSEAVRVVAPASRVRDRRAAIVLAT